MIGLAPVHTPLWQVSTCVHASPSSQGVPFVLIGLVQSPSSGLQRPG
jgi:hypothetical protein